LGVHVFLGNLGVHVSLIRKNMDGNGYPIPDLTGIRTNWEGFGKERYPWGCLADGNGYPISDLMGIRTNWGGFGKEKYPWCCLAKNHIHRI
jgi:hypothetical protein